MDSHCHIGFRNFDAALDEVASGWREAGVQALVFQRARPGLSCRGSLKTIQLISVEIRGSSDQQTPLPIRVENT